MDRLHFPRNQGGKIVTGNAKHLALVPGMECEDWIQG